VLKKIVLALAALLALLVVVVALQPSRFAVERSAAIQAPPELVYPHVENLRAWEAWNPWQKVDPEIRNQYSGPAAGVGATSSWEGRSIGKGSMTITAVKPDREVDIELRFHTPMEATNHASLTLVPQGDATRVTWRMDGSNGFVAKAFSLVMSMDAMVGGEFEKGLASLKALAEADAQARAERPANEG
jgi:hypothetical protein